jgi:hypothetical protein
MEIAKIYSGSDALLVSTPSKHTAFQNRKQRETRYLNPWIDKITSTPHKFFNYLRLSPPVRKRIRTVVSQLELHKLSHKHSSLIDKDYLSKAKTTLIMEVGRRKQDRKQDSGAFSVKFSGMHWFCIHLFGSNASHCTCLFEHHEI